MAMWAHVPVWSYSFMPGAPKTLVTRYGDGTEHRRQKATVGTTYYDQRHEGTKDEISNRLAQLRTYMLLSSFTIETYDPEEASGHEARVVVHKQLPRMRWLAPDTWGFSVRFREVTGEA